MWMQVVPPIVRRHSFRLFAYGLAILAGVVLGWLVPRLGGQSLYRLIMIILGGMLGVGMLISGEVKRLLVTFLVITIPMNLLFTPFGDVEYHAGGAFAGFVIYLYDVPLLALVLVWASEIFLGRRRLRLTLVDAVAGLWIVWSFASIYNSADQTLTLFEVFRMIKLYLLGHVLASVVETEDNLQDIVLAFMVTLLMQSGVGIMQYFFGVDFGGLGFVFGDFRRISGLIGWPNTFGAYMAAVLCFPVAAWFWRGNPRLRAVAPLLAVIGLMPLIFSFSRGAWLGLVAGGVAIIVLGRVVMPLRSDTLIRVALIALVGMGVLLAFIGEISDRLEEDTLTVREQLNEVAFNMIETEPILGIGLNTFEPVMHRYDTVGVSSYFRQPVHNIYLMVAAETGLVGLALFLALVAAICWQGLKVLRQGSPLHVVTQLGALGALLVLLATNLFDVHLRTDVIFAFFWVLAGLTMALRQLAAQYAQQTQREQRAARQMRRHAARLSETTG